MTTNDEYNELTKKAWDTAQQQFVNGLNTGKAQERHRLIALLLEKEILRESLFSTPEELRYVAMGNQGDRVIDLGSLE